MTTKEIDMKTKSKKRRAIDMAYARMIRIDRWKYFYGRIKTD